MGGEADVQMYCAGLGFTDKLDEHSGGCSPDNRVVNENDRPVLQNATHYVVFGAYLDVAALDAGLDKGSPDIMVPYQAMFKTGDTVHSGCFPVQNRGRPCLRSQAR